MAGKGWLCSPLGPACWFRREQSVLGTRSGGAQLTAWSWALARGIGAWTRWAGGPQLGGVCAPGWVQLWAHFPAQIYLNQCPGCGPRGVEGIGKVRFRRSSPSCTHPGWATAGGSSHTGQSQSHRKLQGTRVVRGAAPAPRRGAALLWGSAGTSQQFPAPGCRPPTWPRAGLVLQEQVVQSSVGALRAGGHGLNHHLGGHRARQPHAWPGLDSLRAG